MKLGVFLLVVLLPVSGAGERKRWQAPTAAKRLKNPVPPRAESIAQGRRLFQNYCVVCHGVEGRGDGPWVEELAVPPGDLSDPAVMNAMSDGEIFWKISEGRDPMSSYASNLSPERRWHLVNYLRALVRKPAPAQR